VFTKTRAIAHVLNRKTVQAYIQEQQTEQNLITALLGLILKDCKIAYKLQPLGYVKRLCFPVLALHRHPQSKNVKNAYVRKNAIK